MDVSYSLVQCQLRELVRNRVLKSLERVRDVIRGREVEVLETKGKFQHCHILCVQLSLHENKYK